MYSDPKISIIVPKTYKKICFYVLVLLLKTVKSCENTFLGETMNINHIYAIWTHDYNYKKGKGLIIYIDFSHSKV